MVALTQSDSGLYWTFIREELGPFAIIITNRQMSRWLTDRILIEYYKIHWLRVFTFKDVFWVLTPNAQFSYRYLRIQNRPPAINLPPIILVTQLQEE